MTSDSLKASASMITAFAAAPAQKGLFKFHLEKTSLDYCCLFTVRLYELKSISSINDG